MGIMESRLIHGTVGFAIVMRWDCQLRDKMRLN